MAERGDIDRVREATDLVDLISEVTQVKKSGRSYMAVCPFHQEKTPSMSVDRARGLYHCFGCGKGGDVFDFVRETRGVEFGEALEMLAAKAGITLVRDPAEARKRGQRDSAVAAIREAVEVYHQRLKKSPEAGPARSYLRGRGYDVDLIDEWKLGFAGTDWDTLAKALRSGGIDERVIIDAGLGRRGRRGVYDVFRGRLMFPIHDLRGDPIGFGGRKIDEVPRETTNNPDAKYVNSADSALYQKSRVLFGLDRARPAMGDDVPAVIVEGYTDVIAMHLAGVTTAVATCGTALGEGHFDLLRRFTDRVVLAFDSDEAGSKAALRSDDLETPFRLDLDVRVAVMPDGLDPADLYQDGRLEELVTAVKTARPLLEHRIEREVARHDLSGTGRKGAGFARSRSTGRACHRFHRPPRVREIRRPSGGRRPGHGGSGHRLPEESSGELERSRGCATRSSRGRIVPGGPEQPTRHRGEPGGFQRPSSPTCLHRDRRTADRIAAREPRSISRRSPTRRCRRLARSLVLDTRPLPEWSDVKRRVRLRRLDAEVDLIEAELASMEAGTESHSESLRRLIALQQEKRSLGHD